jgi:hypothetical protein
MSIPGIQLRHVMAVGRGKPPARLDFSPGLNVLWGAANTGKSHVLSLIDFALGASSPPNPIPEQVGYEGVILGFEALDGSSWTLFRSLQGGDFRCVEGLRYEWPDENVGQVLGAVHRASNSLSKFLLGLLDMNGVRLRRNARGDTQDLSFRNLAHLVLVTEGKIQSETSPIETGQYLSKTVEFSLFKYLVTGVDDSSIQRTDRHQKDRVRIAAKLELIDSQIADAEQDVRSIVEDRDELGERDQRLEATMNDALKAWETASVDHRALSGMRRDLQRTRESLLDRSDEIELLLERFSLLNQHYLSDTARLLAIEDAASIFAALNKGPCPWCGADETHRGEHAVITCEGNVDVIRAAARAEREKIALKQRELTQTVERLRAENSSIEVDLGGIDAQISALSDRINEEFPDVRMARAKISDLMLAKNQSQRVLARFENLERLRELRKEIVGDDDVDSVALIAAGDLDTVTLDELSQTIERILVSWQFPGQRVFFDISKRDIQVSGKPRRANGKGVRAVLHSAFSLGLMQYTFEARRPHPRLLVLDSPLVTYRDPLTDDEIALAHSTLSERFYEPFRTWDRNLQVLVIENRDPPPWISDFARTERFTGHASFGRAGFYPIE